MTDFGALLSLLILTGKRFLVGGNKIGQRRFYQELISTADKRFAAHVAGLKQSRS